MTDEHLATFGAGCYWGTDKFFKKDFPKSAIGEQGIVMPGGQVGFMGPADAPKNPSYRDVCSGVTGHVEVFHFRFDKGSCSSVDEVPIHLPSQFS